MCGFCSIFLTTKYLNPQKLNLNKEQTENKPYCNFVPQTKAEEVYAELAGNLVDSITEEERKPIIELAQKIVDKETTAKGSKLDMEQMHDEYKDIISLLNPLTLKYSTREDRNNARLYFSAISEEVSEAKKNLQDYSEYLIDNNVNIKSENSQQIPEKDLKTWEMVKRILPDELLSNCQYFHAFESIPQEVKQQVELEDKQGKMVTVKTTSVGCAGGAIQGEYDEDGLTLKSILAMPSNLLPVGMVRCLVHEYGHVITCDMRNQTTGFEIGGNELFKSYLENGLGYIANEMHVATEIPEEYYLFYVRHKDDFVSAYAATNWLEDFAETFVGFVFDEKYDSPVLKRKMELLELNPQTADLKQKIQKHWELNGIKLEEMLADNREHVLKLEFGSNELELDSQIKENWNKIFKESEEILAPYLKKQVA